MKRLLSPPTFFPTRFLSRTLIKMTRSYTRRTPIHRGKYRLITLAMRLAPELLEPVVVQTKDGAIIRADLSTGMHTFVYFLGDYEPAVSDIFRKLIQPGSICLDVGANFGWYAILFHKLVGKGGEVHAFEPVPPTFDDLRTNWGLAGSPGNLYINNLALTETKGELTLNIFPDMPSGHASAAAHGRDDTIEYKCSSISLNDYLAQHNITNVDVVKADIEGGELSFLRGASSLFSQPAPPIIIMEMALNTTQVFGYLPNDLIRLIGASASYSFYRIDEVSRRLYLIDGFDEGDLGANVLCVPEARSAQLHLISSRLG